MTIVILLIIFGYAGFIIYRKVKDMKNGKFCSCGCSSCPSSSRCKDTELKK